MSERIRPYGGNSRNRLTRLINQTNSTDLVEGVDFEYGAPFEQARASTNTAVWVIPKSLRFRAQKFNYRRLNLKALDALPAGEVHAVAVSAWPFGIHENLKHINDALGVDLTAEEVRNDIYNNTGQSRLVLHVTDASYAWVSGDYAFKITQGTELSALWKKLILDGLYAPAQKA